MTTTGDYGGFGATTTASWIGSNTTSTGLDPSGISFANTISAYQAVTPAKSAPPNMFDWIKLDFEDA